MSTVAFNFEKPYLEVTLDINFVGYSKAVKPVILTFLHCKILFFCLDTLTSDKRLRDEVPT